MKNYVLLIFIFLTFTSCSQKKSGTQSKFKIIVGASALEVPMNGGAYLELVEKTASAKEIIKLDAENSTLIPFGTYQLLFVTFAGPLDKAGSMYCGSVDNAVLETATATFEVTLSQGNCSQEKYSAMITKLTGNSNWDSATFDNSKWAP